MIDNKDTKRIYFNGWFCFDIPLDWEYAIEEDSLDVYDNQDGEGALQFSFLKIGGVKHKLREFMEIQISRFIKQFGIVILENTYEFTEASQFISVSAAGKDEDDFIKVWVLGKGRKILLITYISRSETEEKNTVEKIVQSIHFDDE